MKKMMFLVTLAVMLVSANIAGAVYMDFDNLPLGSIDGQHLGTAPHGVTFTGGAYVANGNQDGWGWTSPYQVVTNDGFMTYNPMTLTFDVPRGFVAFTVGDEGADLEHVLVTAYDANDNVLEVFDSGVFGGNAFNDINYMNDQYRFILDPVYHIKKLVIQDIGGGAGILLDDLEFCQPVPVPAALWLLGSGLVGLVGLRRKFIR